MNVMSLSSASRAGFSLHVRLPPAPDAALPEPAPEGRY
jgi:hypothetical protein